ncbi:hypothetical protein DM826_01900 [Halonotius aquaticus]|uniref:Uncharacterized protein n=1 Tax=Halonotius aquaticus TaxID=2216978 RepID=A0A3A6QFC8_9EURY|nr:hypothetical protein [Halonotius aquaticus]RJX44882.1 hypothetical protein DM826_01900 [Halonotius aquaticus]
MKGFQSTRRIETAATSAATSTVRRGQHLLQHGQRALHTTVRWLGFWAAIVLPMVYLPVLAAEIGPAPGLVGLGLLGCHLLALVAGHNYNTHDL